MTHVSKQKLDPELQAKLVGQLTELFAAANNRSTHNFFNELFSDAEQTMLIKRLAIILLLAKGVSKYRISQSLKVSESTVRLIKVRYDNGEFTTIVKAAGHSTFDNEKFWRTLEVLIRGGMPSRGKDRWRGFGFN